VCVAAEREGGKEPECEKGFESERRVELRRGVGGAREFASRGRLPAESQGAQAPHEGACKASRKQSKRRPRGVGAAGGAIGHTGAGRDGGRGKLKPQAKEGKARPNRTAYGIERSNLVVGGL